MNQSEQPNATATDSTISELEAQLAKARQRKAEQERFEAAVNQAAQDKLKATFDAMIEIEKKRHAEAMAAISQLFEVPEAIPTSGETAVPSVFAGS